MNKNLNIIDSDFLIMKINQDGYIVECSMGLLKLLKYEKDELINIHVDKIISQNNRGDNFNDIVDKLKFTVESISLQHAIISAYKKTIDVYGQYWYKENINGEKYININFVEISNNIKYEHKEKDKEMYNSSILDNLDSKVGIIDSNGNFKYYNKSMESLICKIELNYFRQRDFNIFGNEISNKIMQSLKNNKLKYEIEHDIILDNIINYFKISVQSIDENNSMITIIDIKKEKIHSKIIDKADIGIILEIDNGITYFNNKAKKILGIENNECYLNKRLIEYIDLEYRLKFIEKIYNNRDLEKVEYYCKSNNEKNIKLSLNLDISNEINEYGKLFFINDDFKNNINKELYINNNIEIMEKIEYERLRTEFFSNISHELRTPLNLILSIAQLIENKNRGSYYCKYNDALKKNCQRLLRTINNLIEITKLDVGHIKLNLGNYNIINIIEEITIATSGYIQSKGIELVFDTEIEEKIMACDPEKIECIILNLLANAAKFSSYGDCIEVYIEEDLNNYIKIHIKDSGVGIPYDKRENIFDRFRQVDKSLYRSHEGSGIGLALVKSFTELHGGDVIVKSEVGLGSEFIIRFPTKSITLESVYQIEEYNIGNIEEKVSMELSDIYFNE